MSVKIVSLMVGILLLSFISETANAQTATTTSDVKRQTADLRQEKKTAISQIREKTKEEIQALRIQFRQRVQTIKDARKKALTQKIDTDIATANAKHTNRFNEVLTKLQRILDKITPDAKDTKTLSDIKTAQTAVDVAKSAVLAQTAKEYTIEITDETTLKKNVGATISQFRSDLMQTFKIVMDAKQAVEVLRTDKLMNKKEATSSANL